MRIVISLGKYFPAEFSKLKNGQLTKYTNGETPYSVIGMISAYHNGGGLQTTSKPTTKLTTKRTTTRPPTTKDNNPWTWPTNWPTKFPTPTWPTIVTKVFHTIKNKNIQALWNIQEMKILRSFKIRWEKFGFN